MANRLLRLFGGSGNAALGPAKLRDNSNLDIVLPWALAKAGDTVRYPVAYVEFLRSCLERKSLTITTIKKKPDNANEDSIRRFASLLDALPLLPPIEFSISEGLARAANAYLADSSPLESGNWSGDVRAHFEMSSSFGYKGRILAAIIRYMRCRRCLELGTAYGMSAMFMLEALVVQSPDTRLITVEGMEKLHRIASELLKSRYAERVECEYGWTSVVLPPLAKTHAPVDFLFHDAGHSRKDYVEDFRAALPLLAPGAVVLFDDINWNDPRFAKNNPQCHKGWLEVAGHARVAWAVEIDGAMGLALLI
jgi:predicted O-methyltransferase YrrM